MDTQKLLLEAQNLLQSHKPAKAVALCGQVLSVNPSDIAGNGITARALLVLEKYKEALPFYEHVDAYERGREIMPGHPGRQMDISCLYWFMGNRPKAIELMRGLVNGILDRSIQYATDIAGMTQGLLLYYMSTTANQRDPMGFALDYMRNRLKRKFGSRSWPCPVAHYYLGDISFDDLLAAATGQRDLSEATAVARADLLSRRHLCGALFHDGVKSRAQGAEDQCLARMRECYALEDPLIEPEWYLARYEAQQVTAKI